MGDAKDILGLSKLGEKGGTEKWKTPKVAIKKPDGVHREVNFCKPIFCVFWLYVIYNWKLVSDFAVNLDVGLNL